MAIVKDQYPDTHNLAPEWMTDMVADHYTLERGRDKHGWPNNDGIDFLFAEETEPRVGGGYKLARKKVLAWRIHKEGNEPYQCANNDWYTERVDDMLSIASDLRGY